MNRQKSFLTLLTLFLLMVAPVARAQRAPAKTDGGGPFFGVDLGVSEPTNDNYRAHVHTGGTAAPFAGYMLNDWLGIQGQLHFTFQPPDNDHGRDMPGQVGLNHENRYTTMAGVTVGPRIAQPIGDLLELYATGQGGGFKGVSGRLNQWAPGFSVGGGLDVNVMPNFSVGLFGRWNRAYMAPRPNILLYQVADEQGPADAEWVTAGVGLKWSFKEAAAAPPPPPPPAAVVRPPALPPPTKEKIVLRAVHFDFDKSNIRPDARVILDEAASILKERRDINVAIQGHTDGVGTDAYNMKLSHRRAASVEQYLVKHGVAASRLSSEGFGKRQPVASNDTDEGRAQNRRVELQVK
ncbi:MAG TPA: OmpA family protein [Candidatus Binatia bacterium]|jgi:outer membrane protein OmpA-like peptidoglycan-associated protein